MNFGMLNKGGKFLDFLGNLAFQDRIWSIEYDRILVREWRVLWTSRKSHTFCWNEILRAAVKLILNFG